MKKRINKHIEKKDFVKVYLADHNGFDLINFSGVIFAQNEEFVVMSSLYDFNEDGFVVISKSDISEIKKGENELFYDKIIISEGIKQKMEARFLELDFKLGTYAEMFESIKNVGFPIIIQNLYGPKSIFLIGPIFNVKKKKVFIDYFNARGEYDLKPVSIKYKDITFFRFDDLYSNLFFKHSKRVE